MENFWRNVDIKSKDECWPWMKGKTRMGYGTFWHEGKSMRANRLALIFSGDLPPYESALSLHSCDNPSCCNPNHLRWGTQAENMSDTVLRKRAPFGERGGNASIKEETAEKIMKMRVDGFIVPEIAESLGLSNALVMGVYTGRSWSYLHGVNGNPTLEELKSSKPRKKKSPQRKMTDAMVDRILTGRMTGLTCKDLAEELGLKEGTVSPVFSGLSYTERHGVNGNPTTEELKSFKVSRKALSFDETTEVIRLLSLGYSSASIAEKFGVGKATISRIKNAPVR
jgi:DNA-binding NarL/FixJ family response regulator